ncbi:hypothetical protein [Amycolatopsis sp. PS_44_ISF1]|uniref:hypothetical protein n=1 Tax=Amycolatopsis sp. PS_44_ISF1 TaxID=2974917 RepID=UPI0028E084AF|nr:hypothetical protein [Amycolatopsis sp. PS_44_ISF1]MDT8915263.1 hypothetical protein [Amycolatopsis sp. PS_44_ISF1]
MEAEKTTQAAVLNLSIFEVNKVAVQLADAQRTGDLTSIPEAAQHLSEVADHLRGLAAE